MPHCCQATTLWLLCSEAQILPLALFELLMLEPQDDFERAAAGKAIELWVYRYTMMCQVEKLNQTRLVAASCVITANLLNFC